MTASRLNVLIYRYAGPSADASTYCSRTTEKVGAGHTYFNSFLFIGHQPQTVSIGALFKPGSSTPSFPDMHYYYVVTQLAAFPAAIGCRYSNHTLEYIPRTNCYYTTQTVVTRIH
ncbi:hypothetical protein K449DRAFT_428375 [Hypoxylon sp. EC38]|nr:hypothetical protein K449DRAFT_428375 [Hypoxylon sp. EC38]